MITYIRPRDIFLTIIQPVITITALFTEESFQDVNLSFFLLITTKQIGTTDICAWLLLLLRTPEQFVQLFVMLCCDLLRPST